MWFFTSWLNIHWRNHKTIILFFHSVDHKCSKKYIVCSGLASSKDMVSFENALASFITDNVFLTAPDRMQQYFKNRFVLFIYKYCLLTSRLIYHRHIISPLRHLEYVRRQSNLKTNLQNCCCWDDRPEEATYKQFFSKGLPRCVVILS